MTKRLQDKTALVFGAGSVGEGWGNGKAAAVAYAREGAQVMVVDRDRQAAETTAAIIIQEGYRAEIAVADVTEAVAIQQVVDATQTTFGSIDILHNNVGINAPGGPVEASEESWDRVLDINLKSVFLACKFTLPVMVAQGGGAIVNISSLASLRWLGYAYVSYAAAKAGVNSLTRSVALEYAERGIRANTIVPGLLDTPHTYQHMGDHHYGTMEEMIAARNAIPPMKRMGDAWDVANAAVFLASDESRYITGIELCVDGGLHAKGC